MTGTQIVGQLALGESEPEYVDVLLPGYMERIPLPISNHGPRGAGSIHFATETTFEAVRDHLMFRRIGAVQGFMVRDGDNSSFGARVPMSDRLKTDNRDSRATIRDLYDHYRSRGCVTSKEAFRRAVGAS